MPNFLDLPAEIRSLIYAQVATPPKPPNHHLALFNTSKFIRKEAALAASQQVYFFLSESISTSRKATPFVQNTLFWLSIALVAPKTVQTGLWRLRYLSGSEISRGSCSIVLNYGHVVTKNFLKTNAIIQALKNLTGFRSLFIYIKPMITRESRSHHQDLGEELAPSLGEALFSQEEDKEDSRSNLGLCTPYLKFKPYSFYQERRVNKQEASLPTSGSVSELSAAFSKLTNLSVSDQ